MKVTETEGLPIKCWADNVDGPAWEQALNLAKLPFARGWIALMPDAHPGYGMPIGGVLAARRVVVPNAVGVDIGCGMAAWNTEISAEGMERDDLVKILERIRDLVPVGFSHHNAPCTNGDMPLGDVGVHNYNLPIVKQEYDSARRQLGTLGGGNHFVELQRSDVGELWVMVHSGSRNLGKKVADHYNKLARGLDTQWHSSVPPKWDLAFLPIGSEEAESYLGEMGYCLEFARLNRGKILEAAVEAVGAEADEKLIMTSHLDVHHNYAAIEHHLGEDLWIHRKGATRAREGELGIIPGSMGTRSYIVEGLGSKDSLDSCSHGAGRRMGRGQAKRELNLADEAKRMDEAGIVHGMRSRDDLDEAPGAYKDIEEVMGLQADLVKRITELEPMAVVKG